MIAKNFHLDHNLVSKIRRYAYEKEIDEVVVVRAALKQFFVQHEAQVKEWARIYKETQSGLSTSD